MRPFEQAALVDSTAVAGLAPGSSLLTTNVVFERYRMAAHLRRRGQAWRRRDFEVLEEGGFPLSLAVYEDRGLQLVLEYDPGRYESELVRNMLGHLTTLLTELAAAAPAAKVASLEMPQTDEKHLLLANRSSIESEPSVCYPDLFEQAVADHPTSPAVTCADNDQPLIYAELDRRANQLAHLLRAYGVGPGDRVAVRLPRSQEHAIALLGVSKAEAAFVPLDPCYPATALEHMISDSGAQLVLTHSSILDHLPNAPIQNIVLDRTKWMCPALISRFWPSPTSPCWPPSSTVCAGRR